MADPFATSEMEGALNDVSNGVAGEGSNNVSNGSNNVANDAAIKRGEAQALAREKGWAAPSGYDYGEYGKDAKDPIAGDPNMPTWGHNAQKYEWKEDYGEVGPRNEELEQMLYHSEYITRQGVKFDEWVHLPASGSLPMIDDLQASIDQGHRRGDSG